MKLSPKLQYYSFVGMFLILFGQVFLYLDLLPLAHAVFSLLRFLCFGIALLYVLRERLNLFSFKLGFYFLYLIFLTVVLGGTWIPIFSQAIDTFTILSIFYAGLIYDKKMVLQAMSVSLYFYVLLSLLTELLYPEGMWVVEGSMRFIVGGNYNQIGICVVLALMVNMAYSDLYAHWKPLVYGLMICSIVAEFLVGSMTSMVGVTVLSLYYIFRTGTRIDRTIIFISALLFIVLQYFFVFSLNLASVNPLTRYFVEEVLGKSSNFTYRSDIWARALTMFDHKMWLGYGFMDADAFKSLINGKSPHNFVLSLLLEGGFLGLFLFGNVFYTVYKKAKRTPGRLRNLLEFGLVVILIMMLMEVYPVQAIFTVFGLLYYIHLIEEEPDPELPATEPDALDGPDFELEVDPLEHPQINIE